MVPQILGWGVLSCEGRSPLPACGGVQVGDADGTLPRSAAGSRAAGGHDVQGGGEPFQPHLGNRDAPGEHHTLLQPEKAEREWLH